MMVRVEAVGRVLGTVRAPAATTAEAPVAMRAEAPAAMRVAPEVLDRTGRRGRRRRGSRISRPHMLKKKQNYIGTGL